MTAALLNLLWLDGHVRRSSLSVWKKTFKQILLIPIITFLGEKKLFSAESLLFFVFFYFSVLSLLLLFTLRLFDFSNKKWSRGPGPVVSWFIRSLVLVDLCDNPSTDTVVKEPTSITPPNNLYYSKWVGHVCGAGSLNPLNQGAGSKPEMCFCSEVNFSLCHRGTAANLLSLPLCQLMQHSKQHRTQSMQTSAERSVSRGLISIPPLSCETRTRRQFF